MKKNSMRAFQKANKKWPQKSGLPLFAVTVFITEYRSYLL